MYSRMYSTHAEVDEIGRRAEPPFPDVRLDALRRQMPFVLCEYAHAMGNGRAVSPSTRTCSRSTRAARAGSCGSGLITAWRRRRPTARASTPTAGDFGEVLHDGNFVADGLRVS